MVQPGHGREALGGDAPGVVHGNEAVGVGGVAHHQHADVVGGALGQRPPLRGEDGAVGLEEVLALHALRTRAGADQQGDVHTFEGLVVVVGLHDAFQQRERAVLHLHHHAPQGVERGRDLLQVQDDGLVRPEHLTAGDAEQEAVADLAGGAGDGHADGGRGCHFGPPCPSYRRSTMADANSEHLTSVAPCISRAKS